MVHPVMPREMRAHCMCIVHPLHQVMVEQLQPEGMRSEVSLEADLPQLAFRKLRKVRVTS